MGGAFLEKSLHELCGRRANVEIVHKDGIWTRRMGSLFLPDGPRFEYKYEDPSSWTDQLSQYAIDTKEFWLLHYSRKKAMSL